MSENREMAAADAGPTEVLASPDSWGSRLSFLQPSLIWNLDYLMNELILSLCGLFSLT